MGLSFSRIFEQGLREGARRQIAGGYRPRRRVRRLPSTELPPPPPPPVRYRKPRALPGIPPPPAAPLPADPALEERVARFLRERHERRFDLRDGEQPF